MTFKRINQHQEGTTEEWSKNDYELEEWLTGSKEFSVEADIKFKEHLDRLNAGVADKFWYGLNK